jgi:hypothetical protein
MLDHLRLMREWFQKSAELLKNMDPKSAEYYTDWKVLQNDFDDQYRIEFGNDAFLRYQQRQEQANNAAQP